MGRFIDRIRERRANRRFNRDFNEAMENAYGDNYEMTSEVEGYHKNAFRNGIDAFNEAVENIKFKNAHPRTASQSRFVEDNDTSNMRYVMLEKARQSLSAIDPSSMKPLQRQETDMDVWNRRASELSGGRLKNIADVVAFQKENGLVADGKVGTKTLAALNGLNKKNSIPTNTPKKRFDDNENIEATKPVNIRNISNNILNSSFNPEYKVNTEIPNAIYDNAPTLNYTNTNNDNDSKGIIRSFFDWISSNSNGQYIPNTGAIRFASGGSMNNQEFIKYLAECTGATDEQSLKKAIKTLGEKGVNALKEMFNKGVPASEVKKRISGQSQYMKKGGCLSCEGKMARFANASKPELKKIVAHANVNTISTLKCGGKAKKKMIKKNK